MLFSGHWSCAREKRELCDTRLECHLCQNRLSDRRLVDLLAIFVDYDHTSVLVVANDVERDVMRDQVSGLPRVVFARAVQTDRIFEPKAIGDIEMKNGH